MGDLSPHFSKVELACHHCGQLKVEKRLLEALEELRRLAGKPIVDVTFPGTTPAGSKVWFTAFWFNNRKQDGPAATPIGINIPGGSAMAA